VRLASTAVTLPGQLGLHFETPRPAGATPALSDRLCALLVRRGRPLEVGQVASQLLRLRRCPERLQRRLVAEIIEGDARLAWLGRDLVGLAPQDWATRDLREGTFCVVDLETTGGSPGRSKVTEIGAVRIEGMRVVDRFATLVDPGGPIPEMITRLTGIDDALVEGAPPIEEALERFIAFAGQDVLVAHNAPFDLRFLNHERRRAAGTYFTQPWLDTLTMSRRLLGTRVGRHDLSTLAAWADTAVRPVHRALPDAEATAELLLVFIEMLAEAGHDTLERAVAFAAPGGTRHSWKLALADDLPARPGIYLMRDASGGVLYVGKALDLRRRVRSYFGPGGRHGRLIGRALEQLERIDHEVCDSDLDALLTESRLLRDLRPPCNRRGIGGPTWRLVSRGGAYARLGVARPGAETSGEPLAEAGGERLAERVLSLIHDVYPIRTCHPLCPPGAGLDTGGRPCAGPCGDGDAAAHAAAVAEVAGLFSDRPGPALARLGTRLIEAAAEGRWNADEDGMAALRATLGLARSEWRRHSAARRTAVLAEPAGTPREVVLFAIWRGAVVGRAVVRPGAWDGEAALLLQALSAAEAGATMPTADPAEAAILEQRIRDRGTLATVVLPEGWRAPDMLERIGRVVAWAAAQPRRARPEPEGGD